MNPPPFAVLVVEDEAIVAHDLHGLLESAGYRVVGPVDSSEAAMTAAARESPDLALMDIRIRGAADGIETARRCWSEFMLPSVFVTALAGEQHVRRAAHPSVLGYIVKPFDDRQLLTTLTLAQARCATERGRWSDLWKQNAVAESYARIAAEVETVTRVLEQAASAPVGAGFPGVLADLTAREREVLRLLLGNHRVPAIAELLFISPHTVRNHLKAIYRKADVRSQSELIELMRQGRPAAH